MSKHVESLKKIHWSWTQPHNNTSWYTDSVGLLDHSPSRGSLYYKGPAFQKIIPFLGGPLINLSQTCTSYLYRLSHLLVLSSQGCGLPLQSLLGLLRVHQGTLRTFPLFLVLDFLSGPSALLFLVYLFPHSIGTHLYSLPEKGTLNLWESKLSLWPGPVSGLDKDSSGRSLRIGVLAPSPPIVQHYLPIVGGICSQSYTWPHSPPVTAALRTIPYPQVQECCDGMACGRSGSSLSPQLFPQMFYLLSKPQIYLCSCVLPTVSPLLSLGCKSLVFLCFPALCPFPLNGFLFILVWVQQWPLFSRVGWVGPVHTEEWWGDGHCVCVRMAWCGGRVSLGCLY